MGTKTALFGQSRQGVMAIEDQSLTTGNRFFVDSGATTTGGTTSGFGQSPDAPFTTLDSAIGNCSPNNGDVVFVMPGHAENVTTINHVDLDVAGVSIIGLGHGASAPTFSATATAGGITIGAASVVIKNLRFVANVASGATNCLELEAAADNCTIDGCVFRDTTTDKEWLIHINVATGVDDLTIKNCNFITLAGTMTSSVFFVGTTSNLCVKNNFWHVDCSASVLDHLADVPTACAIIENDMANIDTGAGLCIGLKSDGAATGYIAYNRLFGNLDSAEPLAATNDYMKLGNDAGNTIVSSGRFPHPAAVAAVP